MKFLLDENAEARIATFLNSHGHDALRVGQDFPPGIPDDEVLAIAVRENRVLITNDSDYGELIFLHHRPHAGVLYLRFPDDTNAVQKIASIEKLLSTHQDQLGQFLVVNPRGVRIRK